MSSMSTPLRQSQHESTNPPPSVDSGHSPTQLTPKSKVKAMLATLDDDSDNESTNPPGLSATRLEPVNSATNRDSSNCPRQQDPSTSPSISEEEDYVATRPRGRIARRLQVQHESDEDAANETSYERIKRQLIDESGKDPTAKDGEPSTEPATDASGRMDQVDSQTTPEPRRRTLVKRHVTVQQDGSPTTSQDSCHSLVESPLQPRSSLPDTQASEASDLDLPAQPHTNSRFLELVARKRQEREAKEAEEERKRVEKYARIKRAAEAEEEREASSDDNSDSVAVENLTQQSRPARKASKKALEEMTRETQRMARNMQLTHEARTKKKITKQSLFERFNFKPAAGYAPSTAEHPVSDASATTAPVSSPHGSTPPTSPMVRETPSPVKEGTTEPARVPLGDEEFPLLKDVMSAPAMSVDTDQKVDVAITDKRATTPQVDKGKKIKGKSSHQKPMKIGQAKTINLPIPVSGDSDSDLEIISTKKVKELSIWDRVPDNRGVQSSSLQKLRLLANLTSPGKQNTDKSATMSRTELATSLQQKARQQALRERQERLQELKRKGIIVQTAEERNKEEAEVEDLLSKARTEAEEIMRRENAATKKEKAETGEVDILDDDSEADADWAEDNGQEALGSDEGLFDEDEDEEEGEEEEEDEKSEALLPATPGQHKTHSALIENEADEADEEADDESGATDSEGSEDELEAPNLATKRKNRQSRLVIDDEDDEDEATTVATTSTTKSARKPTIPGLPTSDPAPLGLTQIFAGTMDADYSPTAGGNVVYEEVIQEQDSLEYLRGLPAPTLPGFDDASQNVIKDSQTGNIQPGQTESVPTRVDLHYSQSQLQHDTLKESQNMLLTTQFSEIPDPTQDAGFGRSSPLPARFVEPPPSTVETVLLDRNQDAIGEASNSPAVKRGRLRRRAEVKAFSDEETHAEAADSDGEEFEVSANAFDVMRKRVKKPAEAGTFDKKKSDAKGMVEEQAEESEDEYAGLGGASDEGSDDEEDAEAMKDMVDDETQDVDESRLAAYYADKERASDEKQVEKLFKDISNGMLRRKRGADYDLSDSDDDGEARRRMKRREFAKMRKALLEDENIGRIATDPKKMAFLRAIEDRDKDEELDFLDADTQPVEESQEDASQAGPPPPDAADISRKRKQPVDDEGSNNDENRPPPNLRRVQKDSKPTSLAQIRESLSSLMEPPNAVPQFAEAESSDEAVDPHTAADEQEAGEASTSASNPRRTRSSKPIIDRLALLRTASAETTRTSTKLAFQDPATAAPRSGFRVPALLRRATTNQLVVAGATVASTERAAGKIDGGGDGSDVVVKRGGAKSSSINWGGGAAGRRAEDRRERGRDAGRKKHWLGKTQAGQGLAGLVATGGWE